MSTEWGFHCKTCGLDSAMNLNHGEDVLSEAFRCRRAIVEIRKCQWLEFKIPHTYEDETRFLCEHAEHDLCLKNEYGETKEFEKLHTDIPPQIQHFRQLVSADGLESELTRCDPAFKPTIKTAIRYEWLPISAFEGDARTIACREYHYETSTPARVFVYRERVKS